MSNNINHSIINIEKKHINSSWYMSNLNELQNTRYILIDQAVDWIEVISCCEKINE